MKKLLILLPLFLLFCEKEPLPKEQEYILTVWTTETAPWVLYIDEKQIGPVRQPYPINTTDKIPVCRDERFTNVKLEQGRHHYNLRMTLHSGQLIMSDYQFFEITEICTVLRITQ